MIEIAELTRRLERLEARSAIMDLMQRYGAAADSKYHVDRMRRSAAEIDAAAHRQAQCFAQDAEWEGGPFGGVLRGRDAIASFFRTSPWRFTSHHFGSSSIDVSGGDARAEWRLVEIGVREDGRVLLLTGVATLNYSQVEGEGWQISRMAYERLHSIALGDHAEALKCLVPLAEAP